MRIQGDIERGRPIRIVVNGEPVPGYEGETVAAIMLASGPRPFRDDREGAPRGLYCNMGTCSECMVLVERRDGTPVMLRACLLPARDGMQVKTVSDHYE